MTISTEIKAWQEHYEADRKQGCEYDFLHYASKEISDLRAALEVAEKKLADSGRDALVHANQNFRDNWTLEADGTYRSSNGSSFRVANCILNGVNENGETMFELRADGTLHVHLDGFELRGSMVQRGVLVSKDGGGTPIFESRTPGEKS